MATAGQEAATVGEGQLLYRLPGVLAHTAHNSVWQDIHSPGQREKSVGYWLVGPTLPAPLRAQLLSPDDSIGGPSTQQTVSDWNHAVNGLSSQGKAVTCGPKAIPIEEIDGTFTGSTGHLPPTLQGNRTNHICGAMSDQVPSANPNPPYPAVPS